MPECEFDVNNRDIPYDQPWLKNAIPLLNDRFDNCHRFAPLSTNWTSAHGQCSADMFDVTKKITCTEYIHASDERNLQTEVIKYVMLSGQILSS